MFDLERPFPKLGHVVSISGLRRSLRALGLEPFGDGSDDDDQETTDHKNDGGETEGSLREHLPIFCAPSNRYVSPEFSLEHLGTGSQRRRQHEQHRDDRNPNVSAFAVLDKQRRYDAQRNSRKQLIRNPKHGPDRLDRTAPYETSPSH